MYKTILVAVIVCAIYSVNLPAQAAGPESLPISYENVTVSMTPDEGAASSEITIEGSSFPTEGPNSEGPITYWYGYLNTKCLQIGHFEVGASGSFSLTVAIPDNVEQATTNYVYLNKYCVKITSQYIKFLHDVPNIAEEIVVEVPEPEVIQVLEPAPTAVPIKETIITIAPVVAKGEVGRTGRTGKRGPRGPAGIQGPIGAVGLDGERGPQGPAGQEGPIGNPGSQGPVGDVGKDAPFPLVAILVSMGALIIALIRYYYLTTD